MVCGELHVSLPDAIASTQLDDGELMLWAERRAMVANERSNRMGYLVSSVGSVASSGCTYWKSREGTRPGSVGSIV